MFRNLDENNDWTFGKGINDYATSDEAIGLNIRTRILSWVGDCFFDLPAGIDWLNRLGSFRQRALLEEDLRQIIRQTQDVTELVSLDTTLEDREFTANVTVRTVNGTTYQQTVLQSI